MADITDADQNLTIRVRDALETDPRVSGADVGVEPLGNGRVRLTGTVPAYFSKVAASDAVWKIVGVRGIENDLSVKFPPTGVTVADEVVRERVEQHLRWNPDLDESRIQVSVNSGTITLEGEVSSFWEKISAETEAQRADGTVDIVNKLAIVPSEDLTDEDLAGRVVDRLDREPLVGIDLIDVRVEKGRVILSGTVADWDAWRAAYNAVRFTPGVVDVGDELQIINQSV